MENASKALTMAAGVLFSLLIIGIVTFAYHNYIGLEQEKKNIEETQQAGEFNKPYTAFIRDGIYGSEIISAANLVDDYNKREGTHSNKGYDEIEVVIRFSSTQPDWQYFTSTTYTVTSLLTAYNGLEDAIANMNRVTYANNRTIEYYSNLRTTEINAIRQKIANGEITGTLPTDAQFTQYARLKSERNAYKRKLFKGTAEYNHSTGRIIKLTFEE